MNESLKAIISDEVTMRMLENGNLGNRMICRVLWALLKQYRVESLQMRSIAGE